MAIVIPVTVAPGPILFLLLGRQVAEVAMLIIMIFARPLMVIHDFIVVPHMIVGVVGVVDPIVVMRASGTQYTRAERRRQET